MIPSWFISITTCGPDRTVLTLTFNQKETDGFDANPDANGGDSGMNCDNSGANGGDSRENDANLDANGANSGANGDDSSRSEANLDIDKLKQFILDKISQKPEITQADLAEKAGVSKRKIERVMKIMVDNNTICKCSSCFRADPHL